jgi:hypothetical protein
VDKPVELSMPVAARHDNQQPALGAAKPLVRGAS